MDFTASPSGDIITSPSGYKAFVPNSLPPRLVWDDALVNTLSRASYLLGKLARD
jgi:hypothetical protein